MGINGYTALGKVELNALNEEEKGGRGAPRRELARQHAFAVLYEMQCCYKQISQKAFAEEISSIVEISYGIMTKAGRVVWKKNNSAIAIKQDLHRGISKYDEKLFAAFVNGFIWWRFTTVNPKWGFLVATNPNISFDPKNPLLLFQWIDAAINASGMRATIEQRFEEAKRNSHLEPAAAIN